MPIRCITSRKDVPRRHSTLGSHRLEEPRNGFSNDLCPPIKKLFKYQKSFSCFSYSFWLWPPMAKSAEIDYSGGSEINSNACLFSVVLTTTQLGPMQDVAEKHVISLPFSGNEKATLKVLLWNTWILTQMHENPHYQPVIKGHFWVFLRKPPDHRDIVDSDLHCLGTPKPGLPLLPPARGSCSALARRPTLRVVRGVVPGSTFHFSSEPIPPSNQIRHSVHKKARLLDVPSVQIFHPILLGH